MIIPIILKPSKANQFNTTPDYRLLTEKEIEALAWALTIPYSICQVAGGQGRYKKQKM